MPITLKPWRKEVVIGDELLSKLPDKVKQTVLNESRDDKERMKTLLQYLYEAIGNYERVAGILGLPLQTTYDWMLRLGINVKEDEYAKRRRLAKIKSTTKERKVVMWVLAHSDGNATQCSRQVLVQLGTPDPWLLSLFVETFKHHAEVRIRPRMKSNGRLDWRAWCCLPIEGYSWLLDKKPPNLEGDLLWSLLATLIDAEGSIGLYRKRSYASPQLEIGSENYSLLKSVQDELAKRGIEARLRIEKRKGAKTRVGSFKADYWCLGIYSKHLLREVLSKIVDKLYLPWKRAMATLALQVCEGPTKWDDVADVIRDIRRFKGKTLELSKQIILHRLAESPPRPVLIWAIPVEVDPPPYLKATLAVA